MARLIVGQYHYAARILAGLDAPAIPAPQAALDKRITDLRNPGSVDHRDGWLFQLLSWVAAHHADPKVMITPPHQQPAFKGFDCVILRVSGAGTLVGVTMGEDKATKNARKTITDKVWPELKDYESGRRDDELVATVTSLLKQCFPGEVEKHLEAAFWEKDGRAFRVCIGSHDFRDDESGRIELFGGYSGVAPGHHDRRRAETLYTPGDVRAWMNTLAGEIADALEKLRAARDVR